VSQLFTPLANKGEGHS